MTSEPPRTAPAPPVAGVPSPDLHEARLAAVEVFRDPQSDETDVTEALMALEAAAIQSVRAPTGRAERRTPMLNKDESRNPFRCGGQVGLTSDICKGCADCAPALYGFILAPAPSTVDEARSALDLEDLWLDVFDAKDGTVESYRTSGRVISADFEALEEAKRALVEAVRREEQEKAAAHSDLLSVRAHRLLAEAEAALAAERARSDEDTDLVEHMRRGSEHWESLYHKAIDRLEAAHAHRERLEEAARAALDADDAWGRLPASMSEANERLRAALDAPGDASDEDRAWMDAPLGPPRRRSIASQLGAIYDAALVQARAAAYGCGYAIAVHGSEMRDLDLIAVPWTDEATEVEALVEAIIRMTGGRLGDKTDTRKPHGRRAWTIHLNNEHTLGDFKPVLPYIDLSVMPLLPAGDAPREEQ